MEEEKKEIETPVTPITDVPQEEKPKKNILLFIIVSLVVLVGVGVLLLVLLTGNKDNDKPKEKEQQEQKEEEKKEQNKEENNKQEENNQESNNEDSYFEELDKKIEEEVATYHTNETSTQKQIIKFIDDYLLGGLVYSYDENENVSEPSSELEGLAYSYVKMNDDNYSGEAPVSKTAMDDYFKKVFDVTPTKYQNIMCEMDNQVLYYYKDGKFVYNENHGGHGSDLTSVFIDYYYVDYKEEGNTITAKLILMNYDMQLGYRVNGEYDEKIFDELPDDYYQKEDYELDFITLFHKNIDRYKNNGSLEYTFEKNGNNLILKSFKVVK